MAMSIEKMNAKLEKILKQLDNAIEDRDLAKVTKAINDAQNINKKSEGQGYDTILTELEERINRITEEINSDEELEASEVGDLADIRNNIRSGKDPFEKTKTVVDSLSKKGISQEDLKNYKQTQKNDNLAQIEGIKESNHDLACGIADIEMRYMGKIENNDAAIKIIEDIKKQKDLLEKLDAKTDTAKMDATKSSIKAKISELSAKGVDVSSIQNFESNPSVIDSFHSSKIGELNADSDNIAMGVGSDKGVLLRFKNQYNLINVKNAKDLKDKYKEMVGARQKNASKITTLEAENKQIDKTIQTLEREEQIQGIAYNRDGTQKSDAEIARAVLRNDQMREDINNELDNKFDGKFGERFRARKEYYRENQSVGKVRPFVKTLFSRTKTVKKIEAASMAATLGKTIPSIAYNSDGTLKSDEEIARAVLSDNRMKEYIKNEINNKFDGKFGERFSARKEYYQTNLPAGKIRPFFKALFHKTDSIKRIEATSMATTRGRQIADGAINSMAQRQNDFKESIRREAAKKMSENFNTTENDIRDEVIDTAYKSAFRDDDGR